LKEADGMHVEIARETLKTGETLSVEIVIPPDAERGPQIEPFLGHKPPNYRAHTERALAGWCDELETRYYIGLIDGQMVGNIMTVETGGVGIFGHVHTRSDQRLKGICRAIMGHQMADFRQRDGRVLLLGTGYRSAPYNIYASFGFRDWEPGSPGLMRYDNPAEPDFLSRHFAAGPAVPVRAAWRHWPLVALLAATPTPVHLRSLLFPVWGVGLLEGGYCDYLYRYADRPNASAAVLESATGAVTALATCVPDARWNGAVSLLDLMSHPVAHPADLAALLHALPLPSGHMQCYADPHDAGKIAALEAVGFQRTTVLPEQFRQGDQWQDVWLYTYRTE
jgi:hypothetical protein